MLSTMRKGVGNSILSFRLSKISVMTLTQSSVCSVLTRRRYLLIATTSFMFLLEATKYKVSKLMTSIMQNVDMESKWGIVCWSLSRESSQSGISTISKENSIGEGFLNTVRDWGRISSVCRVLPMRWTLLYLFKYFTKILGRLNIFSLISLPFHLRRSLSMLLQDWFREVRRVEK